MPLTPALLGAASALAQGTEATGTGDSVFALLVLMAAIAGVSGAIEIAQLRKRRGFPIPFILYCHLLPMITFVYAGLAASDEGVNVSYWPLLLALAPLPLVALGRIRSLRSATPPAAPAP